MSAGLVVAVLAAGAVGALVRYGATVAAGRSTSRIPWAVFAVNVLGSLVAGLAAASPLGADVRLVVITGFAGGLTTFSTLSVETIQLVLDRRMRLAIGSIAANLAIGIAAAALGWWIGTIIG